MAKKSNTAKSPSLLTQLTEMFTSGQLIIGIAVTFFLMTLFLMLGILIGRYDPSLRTDRGEMLAQKEEVTDETVASVENAPKSESAPQEEVDVQVPTVVHTPTSAPRKEQIRTTPPTDAVDKSPPASRPLTPLKGVTAPAQESTKTGIQGTSVAPLKEKEPVKVASVPPKKEELPKPLSAQPAPISPKLQLLPNKPPAQTQKKAEKKPEKKVEKPTPVKQAGAFAIQLAAFQGPERVKKAQEEVLSLEKKTGLDLFVVPSKDGGVHKIVLGGFLDRSAAEKKCVELRKQPEFAGAWIITL